jgi:hypothetical protein
MRKNARSQAPVVRDDDTQRARAEESPTAGGQNGRSTSPPAGVGTSVKKRGRSLSSFFRDPPWWFRDVVLSALVACMILALQLYFENRATERQVERDAAQALRDERLENLRFVRDRSARGTDVDRPFARLDLTDQDLSGLQLANADFTGAILDGADLTTANLEGAVFDGASMHDTKLWGAVLTSADFFESDLRNADLGTSTLHNLVVYSADMQGVDLKNADIDRTIFAGRTDLTGARGLEEASITRSCAERSVSLPAEVQIPWNGSCEYRLTLWFESDEVVPSLP